MTVLDPEIGCSGRVRECTIPFALFPFHTYSVVRSFQCYVRTYCLYQVMGSSTSVLDRMNVLWVISPHFCRHVYSSLEWRLPNRKMIAVWILLLLIGLCRELNWLISLKIGLIMLLGILAPPAPFEWLVLWRVRKSLPTARIMQWWLLLLVYRSLFSSRAERTWRSPRYGVGWQLVTINKSALASLLNTEMQSSRVKHIDNRHHQCREEVERGTISYEYCSSSDNLADCLTKTLPPAALESQRIALGLGPVLWLSIHSKPVFGLRREYSTMQDFFLDNFFLLSYS